MRCWRSMHEMVTGRKLQKFVYSILNADVRTPAAALAAGESPVRRCRNSTSISLRTGGCKMCRVQQVRQAAGGLECAGTGPLSTHRWLSLRRDISNWHSSLSPDAHSTGG